MMFYTPRGTRMMFYTPRGTRMFYKQLSNSKLVQTIGTEVDHVTEVEGKASMQIIQHLPVDGFRPDEGKFSPVIYNTDCMGNSQ